MFEFDPDLALKSEERLTNSQNIVQNDSKMKREISFATVLQGMGNL